MWCLGRVPELRVPSANAGYSLLTLNVQGCLPRDLAEVVAGFEDVVARVCRLDVEDDQCDDAILVGNLEALRLLDLLCVLEPRKARHGRGSNLHHQSAETK